jgi:tetratricopeptide (TPR) repeat protein
MSLGRKIAFSAAAFVLFFALVEAVLWVAGVETLLVEEDPYVGFQGSIRLFEPTADGREMRTAANKRALFNDQRFARVKPAGTYRIFALGGSTTYGRPFDDSTSFSGWLRTYLETLAPERSWEVVNAGGISYASYRVATLMEELAHYEPDLFIIYSGNNEFLEKRTYGELMAEPKVMTGVRLALQHSRLWALGRKALRARKSAARERYQMTGEVKEVLDDSAGLEYYQRDDEFSRRVLEHYRFNLQRMINLGRSAGAEVLLVTIPVNERDFSPFKSQFSAGLAPATQNAIERLLADARRALAAGDAAAAADAARQAVELDARYAESHFQLGRALAALGDHQAAGVALRRALSEDVCPLRALPQINETIRQLAAANAVPLVDFERELSQWALARTGDPNAGAEAFLDHVHPTVEVNGLLAARLVDDMAELGVLRLPAEWRDETTPRVAEAVAGRLDATARARGLKNLSKVLLWAGKTEEAGRFAAEAAETLGDDWEVHYNAGVVALDRGDLDAARGELESARRLAPEAAAVHDQLGTLHAREGAFERAVEAGERAVALNPQLAGAWNNLSNSYKELGWLEKARDAARRAVTIEPGFAEAHNNLGNALFALGDLEGATASYGRAVALRPTFAEALVNQGLVLAERGQFEEAERAFARASDLRPGLAAAISGHAQTLLAMGRVAEATAALEQAVAARPSDVEIRVLLVNALMAQGRIAEAGAQVAAGLASAGRNALFVHLQGRLDAAAGDLPAATRGLAEATRLDPGLAVAWLDLATLQLEAGKTAAAEATMRRGLQHSPNDDRLHYLLARSLIATNRIGAAKSSLERALELNPRNAPAANDLAALCEHLGQTERALELYRQAARLDPNLSQARASAERLARGSTGALPEGR